MLVYKVSKRSVRDRLTLLQNRHKEKIRSEERASGIECEETELDRALEEIIEKEQSSNQEKESAAIKTKKDKADAEEQRLTAVKRLGETKNRLSETEGKENRPKRADEIEVKP